MSTTITTLRNNVTSASLYAQRVDASFRAGINGRSHADVDRAFKAVRAAEQAYLSACANAETAYAACNTAAVALASASPENRAAAATAYALAEDEAEDARATSYVTADRAARAARAA